MKSADENLKSKRDCRGCLFFGIDSGLEKCLRFARFVDHVLHDHSGACEYRTSAGPDLKTDLPGYNEHGKRPLA